MLPLPCYAPGSYGPWTRLRKFAAAIVAGLALLIAAPALAGPRIVAIGDSLTAGYGLPQGQGFVPKLDQWLDAQGHADAEIVNMGVSGDTTAGGKARLDWALGEGADGVIIALGGNDLLRGIDPAASRANLSAMLAELSARGLPVLIAGMQAPTNFGPDYKRDFDAIYPDLAAEHGAILYPFFLDGLIGQRELFQDDGIHPNEEGVRRMVEAIGPSVIELIERTGG